VGGRGEKKKNKKRTGTAGKGEAHAAGSKNRKLGREMRGVKKGKDRGSHLCEKVRKTRQEEERE